MKKLYIVPTVETCFVKTSDMMWGLGGSPDHEQASNNAPKRRQTPVF